MTLKWWQTAVFYQVYPPAFADGNGDGVGDLPGLIQKLDYLQDLGVDAIWLSPHYPSPMVDCGYDISDYCAVDPRYGTLEDFKHLVTEIHQRKMHLVLDLVLNHTSDQHEWFQQARSSRENSKHDWYVWREGEPGTPPNNWFSTFGGSAWEWNPPTGEYYYHFFFKEQPDLNWRNPAVKQAMFEMIRFWLRLGVDGFRLDAVGTIFEDPAYPDQESGVDQDQFEQLEIQAARSEDQAYYLKLWELGFKHQHDRPEVHELMREIRKVVDEFEDRVLIGETDDIAFYGNGNDEIHLNFNFPLMRTNRLTARWIINNQRERLESLPEGAWPCNTLNNHDTGRVWSNLGDGKNDLALAKLSLAVVLCLKGTPFLFNGEEIGMRNQYSFKLEDFRDPLSVRGYHLLRKWDGANHAEALQYASHRGRDKGRTPFQWSSEENGGFCPPGVRPWLPVSKDYKDGVNAADQQADPNSLWSFYRRMLHFRSAHPELVEGEFQPLESDENLLAFRRYTSEKSCLVLLNFTDQPIHSELRGWQGSAGVIFNSDSDAAPIQSSTDVRIHPFEIWIGQEK